VAEEEETLLDYCFLASTTVERAIEKTEGVDALTLKCEYYESPETMQSNRPKEIKPWIYRDEAIALARLILRVAGTEAIGG
jgi:hypothetical protein